VTGRTRPYRGPYHRGVDAPFAQFVSQAVADALSFEGDTVALASRARDGDKDAARELSSAYRAVAVLTAMRLRPPWLARPDAAQEATLVLDRLVKDGSTTIAVELPLAIQKTFAAFRPPDAP
jgi:hypothetical protein